MRKPSGFPFANTAEDSRFTAQPKTYQGGIFCCGAKNEIDENTKTAISVQTVVANWSNLSG
jgi:hypothetical protein